MKFQKVDRIVMPLTCKEVKVKRNYNWEIQGNIYDKCGFLVAEVESLFVAEEIVTIMNGHDELVDLLSCK